MNYPYDTVSRYIESEEMICAQARENARQTCLA